MDGGIPALPRAYVHRLRLWEHLDGADSGAATVLIGPAGAGKTLGVSGWLRLHRPPGDTAWITADAGWTPDRLRDVLDRGVRVVVDDAHRLPAGSLALIDDRLRREPRGLRVLLLTRRGLPLTDLVPELLGHLTVLRGDLLRMDDAEATALVAAHARTDAAEVVAAVCERAQGWCAALVLIARAVASARDPLAEAGSRPGGRASGAAARIAGELFAGLSDRERHLLSCTAGEPTVTADLAAHLTRDVRAGEVLADLEAAGLPVTRVPGRGPPVHYRVHPLLAEVVRRRLAIGGPDAARARVTVRDAVRLDLARGESDRAFARLVAVGDHAGAAGLLGPEGAAMVLRGEGDQVRAFVAGHPDVVAEVPAAWFAAALDRWTDGDAGAARHWMDRLLAAPAGDGPSARARLACVHVMRARLGLEPAAEAVALARQQAAEIPAHPAHQAALPLLLFELAALQNWTGDLEDAEVHLSAVIALCRSRRLPALEAEAMAHLALTEYAAGRERACAEVAAEPITLLDAHTPFAAPRARLAARLARGSRPPWTAEPDDAGGPVHPADLCSVFWRQIADAGRLAGGGAVAEAEATLDTPLTLPELPHHLRRVWLLHRGLLAARAADRDRLAAAADDLRGAGDAGEALLLDGLREDLLGNRRAAHRRFAAASAAATCVQPPAAAIATVCEAQLRDTLGDSAGAHDRLRQAVVMTEVRRNGVPFLGWTRHGTPIGMLLGRATTDASSPWQKALARAAVPDVVTHRAPAGPDARADRSGVPVLSPRERDVLHDLARGATYADIAASRFIAESTVKTHVSSLYAKLGASRRSEALAVARRLRLV